MHTCRLIFAQTRQLLGGKIRLILTGGAPLSPDTHELIKICLCEQVIQGYGLTETCSCATVMDSEYINLETKYSTYYFFFHILLILRFRVDYDRTTGRAGTPTTACDIRLVDWDEGNYRVTDKPFPRGEIVIGKSVRILNNKF